jgi:uncharacterized protein
VAGERGLCHARTMQADLITSIDTVRGVAVLGILLLNIISFALPSAAYPNPSVAGGTDTLNLGVWTVVHVAFDGKMRALFAMLFGASMLLVAEKAGAEGPMVHVRRMAALLLIGLVHGWAFWQGDILVYYALIGLLVFPLWKKAPRTLLAIAALLLLLQSAVHFSGAWQGGQLEQAAQAPGATAEDQAALDDFRSSLAPLPQDVADEIEAIQGSWAESFAVRARELQFFYSFLFPAVFLLETMAQMLIGMALFRLGWWQGARPTRHYLRFTAIALPVGLALMALVAHGFRAGGFDPVDFFRAEGFRVLIGPLIALGYAALVIAAVQQGMLPHLSSRLAAVGRMALSNYLATTIICSILFQGWGFGLFALLDRWQLYPIVFAIWLLLLGWSKPWLQRFRYGPAEWLWRSLARWQRQPMRVPAAQ